MSMGTKPMGESPILPRVNRYVSPATMQAFPDMYGNPYGQQTNPYAMQPTNQFGGPSFNQMGGYGPTFANMTGYGNFGGAYQQPQMPQRYSNDYNRFLQSGQEFNEPVMGYNTYGQIFAPPRQQPPSFGKGGGGFRPQPPTPSLGGKGQPQRQTVQISYPGGSRNVPATYQDGSQPSQPPTIGGKGQPQPSGYGGLRVRPGSGPPRVPRTRQLGLNEPTGPGPMDVQTNPTQPQITAKAPEDIGFGGPGPTLPNLGDYFEPGKRSVGRAGLQPVTNKDVGINQRNPSFTGGLGLGGMPTGASQTGAQNRFAISTGDRRYNPETGTYGPSNTVYFDQNPARDNYIPRFGNMGFFQEGGQVPPDAATNMEMMLSEAGPANPQAEMSGEYDRLIQMTMQAILGQVEQPDEIIQMFIDEFGVDAFRQLRDAVLKQQVPNAQTEGMVDGNGGGMDDQVMGMIGAQRPVAVSPGEYIIPADVVSGLGDGSSKSGADILDELSQAVRMTRTGTTEQPRPLMETLSQ